MNRLTDIQGIIFDYGGTIDTNSRHWAEVLWSKYVAHQVPVTKEAFREAYVFGERSLAKFPFVRPDHDFHDVLRIKCKLQMEYLAEKRHLPMDEKLLRNYAQLVADGCYDYVLDVLKVTRPVVDQLAKHYKLVLVSNFYGNIQTILKDFGLMDYLPTSWNHPWWAYASPILPFISWAWMPWVIWPTKCWWWAIRSRKTWFPPRKWDARRLG